MTWHPRRDDAGRLVRIKHPSTPTPPATWADPAAVAVFTPDGPVPAVLNGVAVAPWSPPSAPGAWERLAAAHPFVEPAFSNPAGLEPAAGAVVLEPDGRCWCIEPTGRFGGHKYTFPKGRADGRNLAATALVEVYEETGLAVELTAWLCDVDRSVTRTRFYLARRVGSSPALCGWESQACVLASLPALRSLLTHPGDQQVLDALAAAAPWEWRRTSKL